MPEIERFIEKNFVLRREWEMTFVDADGEIPIGRTYNMTGRKEATSDFLTEVHGGRTERVLSAPGDESATLAGAVRELQYETVLSYLFGDGRAPTIVTYERLERMVRRGTFLRGTAEYQFPTPYGVPQTFAASLFPAPTVTDPPIAATGTVPVDVYYVWAVPVTADVDEKHGIAAFTLANIGNLRRGVDYVCHTPSADGVDYEITSAPAGFTVTLTPASTGLRPTHHFIVVGTDNDINHAASHIAAVLPYGTNVVTISALGSVDFGADPALADLNAVQTITSGSPLVYGTPHTINTDYVYDPAECSFKRTAASAIGSAAPVRLIAWRVRTYNVIQDVGGSELSEVYKWVRLRNLKSRSTNPATRRGEGAVIDFPKVNIASLAQDLLTANPDGYHNPLGFNLSALFDATTGYLARFRGESEDYLNLVDYYSNSTSPANV